VLTLYARHGAGEIALVRWPTTIGGWQREKLPNGRVVTRYKASRPGDFLWREIIAAPAWFAPPSTPDCELVHRSGDSWALREDAIGPGYFSAYGLVMIVHRALDGDDTGARTHGTSNILSVLGRDERHDSHGCHRLPPHLALRLGSFLLAHPPHVMLGDVREVYVRRIAWEGQRFTIRRRPAERVGSSTRRCQSGCSRAES
jgi:hypothetical protein